MRTRCRSGRASGLIIALAVLAMLAIMATTFVSLARLEVRVTANYVDDQRCEMLVQGLLRYVSGIMRDDLDRTWGRYENRDMASGVAYTYGTGEYVNIPGIEGVSYGTPPCNDLWYSAPKAENWGNWGGLYDVNSAYGMLGQECFVWNDYYNRQHGIPGRYERMIDGRWVEADAFIDRIRNCWSSDGTGQVVDKYHRRAGAPIDDDGDGAPNSFVGDLGYGWDWYGSPYGTEQNADSRWYWDPSPSVICSGNQFMFPGRPFARETGLVGGLMWRWSMNLGYGHSMYVNLNTAGNVFKNPAYYGSIGRIGLSARPSFDDQSVSGEHLGRIEWNGFAGEYNFTRANGFPAGYDAVMYHPSQVNLERLFNRPRPADLWGGLAEVQNVNVDPAKARAIVRRRWGNDGKPADGDDAWCVGWRRDGATYYKFASPENPPGDDRYFGVTEVLEHDHASYHGGTSFLASVLTPVEQSRLRPFVTCWSTDTILRGKIWPTEGPPYTNAPGDWKNINILKRVNVNMVGASGGEGLPGEDAALKGRWVANNFEKRNRERDRLYFMLVAAMSFSGTPDAQQKACRFIASLADMVDRDNEETLYVAPDGSGAWGLGVEKFPVINEIVCALDAGANTPTYSMFRFRMELYNPAENIPWIPDADEAYEVKDYVVRLGSVNFLVGDLSRFSALNLNDDMGAGVQIRSIVDDMKRRIGADGLYGVPNAAFPTGQTDAVWGDPTWTRCYHLGWKHSSVSNGNWPTGLTQAILEGPGQSGIEISLWKPLAGDAAGLPISPGKVEDIAVSGNTRRYLCVDTTGTIRLIQPYGGATGLTGPGGARTNYVGNYRRWDPMNARVYDGGNYGKVDSGNVIWCPGWLMASYNTLGRPNVTYRSNAYTNPASSGISPYQYARAFERNFKVVDGDLPSIGWLGELVLRAAATENGPLTLVHSVGQNPTAGSATASLLDTAAKFDLFKPFGDVKNLHVLDCFTVWDPSNDRIDNDGDGAVDDDDTGSQAGDKGGPEVRVFGRIDLNYASQNALLAVFPDSSNWRPDYALNHAPNAGSDDGGITPCRQRERGNDGHGPYETVGDLLRVDSRSSKPGNFLATFGNNQTSSPPYTYIDDDGDGITNERDERDMMFTWMANYFTTRANVFELNLAVDFCKPAVYPGRLLPMKACRTDCIYARKQVLAVIDRSSTLRIGSDGSCDFTGPVEFRVVRFSDDARVY